MMFCSESRRRKSNVLQIPDRLISNCDHCQLQESQTEEEKPEADVKKGEADEEKEEEEGLVELERLMRANFLMVADEVQRE